MWWSSNGRKVDVVQFKALTSISGKYSQQVFTFHKGMTKCSQHFSNVASVVFISTQAKINMDRHPGVLHSSAIRSAAAHMKFLHACRQATLKTACQSPTEKKIIRSTYGDDGCPTNADGFIGCRQWPSIHRRDLVPRHDSLGGCNALECCTARGRRHLTAGLTQEPTGYTLPR